MSLTGLGFTKTAITKMVKMVQAGKISAESAGQATKQLNLNPRELKFMGEGAESVVTLVTDPKHGLAVQKHTNPLGTNFSPKLYAARNNASKKLNQSEFFAKYYGRKKNTTVTTHELMRGRHSRELPSGFFDQVQREARKYTKYNFLDDIRPQNVKGGKVVDYFPDVHVVPRRKHRLEISEKHKVQLRDVRYDVANRFPPLEWKQYPIGSKKAIKQYNREITRKRNAIKYMANNARSN